MWSATPYKLPWGHIKHSLGSTCYYNHFDVDEIFLRDSEKFVPELRENGTLPTALSGALIRSRYRGSHRSRPSDPCLMESKVANKESVKGNSANRFDKSKVYILDGDVSSALGSRLGVQDTTRDKCWPASALKVSITRYFCKYLF